MMPGEKMPIRGTTLITWVGRRGNRWQSAIHDCLFLFIIATLSMANYAVQLGFYSDDWALLASMDLSKNQSLIAVFTEIVRVHDHEIRPLQFLELAALYKLFGLDPLGYHLANSAILLLDFLLLYLLVRALGQARVLALSVCLVFILVPSYSTDRFWIASSAANLSMCFFLLSLHAHWHALRHPRGRFLRWEALAILGVLCSGFSYEVFLPLFLLASAFLFAIELRTKGWRSAVGPIVSKAVLHQAAIVGAVALVLVIKALWAPRVPRDLELIGLAAWTVRAILKAAIINYGYHLLLLPSTTWHVLRYYANLTIVVTAAVVGFAVWIRLYTLPNLLIGSAGTFRAKMSLYLGCGIALFVAGYSLFPIKPAENGPNNRAAIAGTVGFAVSVIGGLEIFTSLFPLVWRKTIFSTAIALISISGALIIGTLGNFWIESFRVQKEILSDIRDHVSAIPAGASLILDGVCPYNGPAPVFNATWDLSGALSLVYGHLGVEANIVTPSITVEQNGLSVPASADRVIYRFGNLYVYHYGRKTSYILPDAQTAQTYFDEISSDLEHKCLPDDDGNGVDVMNGLIAKLRGRE
jgi:hypothetical protein